MMRRLAPAFPLLFVVLWSTGVIGARLGLPHSEPLTFLFVRYLLVVALLRQQVVFFLRRQRLLLS